LTGIKAAQRNDGVLFDGGAHQREIAQTPVPIPSMDHQAACHPAFGGASQKIK
jgi:hypothetical protein